MSGELRDKMPECAAFIDRLREVFGREDINKVIRRGLRAECEPAQRFHAAENGHSLGQPYVPAREVSARDMVVRLPEVEELTPVKRGRR